MWGFFILSKWETFIASASTNLNEGICGGLREVIMFQSIKGEDWASVQSGYSNSAPIIKGLFYCCTIEHAIIHLIMDRRLAIIVTTLRWSKGMSSFLNSVGAFFKNLFGSKNSGEVEDAVLPTRETENRGSAVPADVAQLQEKFEVLKNLGFTITPELTDYCLKEMKAATEFTFWKIFDAMTLLEVDEVIQPAPEPWLSRTPASIRWAPPLPGADTETVLRNAGYSDLEIDGLRSAGAIE